VNLLVTGLERVVFSIQPQLFTQDTCHVTIDDVIPYPLLKVLKFQLVSDSLERGRQE